MEAWTRPPSRRTLLLPLEKKPMAPLRKALGLGTLLVVGCTTIVSVGASPAVAFNSDNCRKSGPTVVVWRPSDMPTGYSDALTSTMQDWTATNSPLAVISSSVQSDAQDVVRVGHYGNVTYDGITFRTCSNGVQTDQSTSNWNA